MILQKEIIVIAQNEYVKTKTIDKDWVLGHFLNAMYSIENVKKNFVFKGGTCLRKCYIDDYRFSEDLDFTLLDNTFKVDSKFIKSVIEIAEKTSGAKFYFERKKLQKFKEEEQGYELLIKFWGADHKKQQKPLPPSRWQTAIKIDMSFSEKLLTPVEFKPIFHNYSDSKEISQIVPVYSLEEIISEKLRALIQRNRPRDIYDIWNLSEYFQENDYSIIKELLFRKAADKNIIITNADDFVNADKNRKNKRAWNRSLADHLPVHKLPDFEKVSRSVREFIVKILNS